MFVLLLLPLGNYIFIEASQKNLGDKARLVSEWQKGGTVLCLQLWYHMHGKHIGSLSVYIVTSHSERLAWKQQGNRGDSWKFAQTTLTSSTSFKV